MSLHTLQLYQHKPKHGVNLITPRPVDVYRRAWILKKVQRNLSEPPTHSSADIHPDDLNDFAC